MKASEADALIVRAANGRRELDLGRDVHALLGLVFDRIDLDGAVRHVQHCVATRRPCFLSTPNVNFVAAAVRERREGELTAASVLCQRVHAAA